MRVPKAKPMLAAMLGLGACGVEGSGGAFACRTGRGHGTTGRTASAAGASARASASAGACATPQRRTRIGGGGIRAHLPVRCAHCAGQRVSHAGADLRLAAVHAAQLPAAG